jgi:hypothetical protein
MFRYPAVMAVSRRDVLLGLAGVGVVGCTAPPAEPLLEEEPPPPADPNAIKPFSGPRVRLADGPSPQHVLVVAGSSELTIYADGLATYRRWGTMDRRRLPIGLLRLADGELRDLQALLGSPGLLGAESSYSQAGIKDGSYDVIVVGARRINVFNDPKNVPPELAAVRRVTRELEQRIEEHGQDAFLAFEPKLLALYIRWFESAGTADQLMVWANGVLDYRITDSNTPAVDGQDTPDPIVRLEQAPRAAVAELTALLAGEEFLTAPAIVDNGDAGPIAGTTHILMHAGPTVVAIRHPYDPPAGQRPVLAALAQLLARFDAPPDEARVPRPAR